MNYFLYRDRCFYTREACFSQYSTASMYFLRSKGTPEPPSSRPSAFLNNEINKHKKYHEYYYVVEKCWL
jgi:hypothetical protein